MCILTNYSIDQWLLKHNRLCPVCKQDVLEPPASHLSTAGEAPSEETIMVTVTSDSTGGSSSIGSESLFLRLRGLCRGLEWIGALTRRSRRRFFLALRDLTNTGTPASSSVTPGNNETELSSAATTNSRYL